MIKQTILLVLVVSFVHRIDSNEDGFAIEMLLTADAALNRKVKSVSLCKHEL